MGSRVMLVAISAIVMCIGVLVGIVLGLGIGMQSNSFLLGMIVFLGLSGSSIFLYVKAIKRINNSVGRINMDSWLTSVSSYPDQYAWDGSGIAINPRSNEIRLAMHMNGELIDRTYPLEDIREYSYEMPGSIVVVGNAGAQGLGTMVGSGIKAIENTGLYLTVKDINYPKWFIKFKTLNVKDKKTEQELASWMEILRQAFEEKHLVESYVEEVKRKFDNESE